MTSPASIGEAEAVEIIEWLKAIREVVREAHFALDDSEDRSYESPPINAVPRSNVEQLDTALEACEVYCPEGEAWDGPGPLVTKIIDRIEALYATPQPTETPPSSAAGI